VSHHTRTALTQARTTRWLGLSTIVPRLPAEVSLYALGMASKPKQPAGPPMTLDTCGPSDGAIRTAVPGGKVMEWFSRRTSIAGTQIPNWVLVLGVVIAFFSSTN
jgi:hypothetical protein